MEVGEQIKDCGEYYQLWRSSGGEPSSNSRYEALYPNPPPLPPRSLHKQLHRRSANNHDLKDIRLQSKRQSQKLTTMPLWPEDCFEFEIVDVDEAPALKVIVEITYNVSM